MPKSMPSSSSRSYSILGIIAVARSRVLVDCRPQNPSIATPRSARCSGVMLSESGMRRCDCKNPLAPRSPVTLRICSAKTGVYSTQCPSPSMTGCERLLRIPWGVACVLIRLLRGTAKCDSGEPMPSAHPKSNLLLVVAPRPALVRRWARTSTKETAMSDRVCDFTFLQGVKVVDFTQFEAGPSCTEALGWLGAEVVKIENPKMGDPGRRLRPGQPDIDPYYFHAFNANKKSITVNLKSAPGLELVKDMIRQADVMIENFAPGAIERLGLSYDVVKAINPSIIYAQVKGFGEGSPFEHNLAFDMIAQACGGTFSVTGDKNGPPHAWAIMSKARLCSNGLPSPKPLTWA